MLFEAILICAGIAIIAGRTQAAMDKRSSSLQAPTVATSHTSRELFCALALTSVL